MRFLCARMSPHWRIMEDLDDFWDKWGFQGNIQPSFEENVVTVQPKVFVGIRIFQQFLLDLLMN